jgi:hypothetical protein
MDVVMDVRWCPTDPVAESLTVLQSKLQQSMTDGEGGRAAKAIAERRGSSGLGGARAPNNINLGWLKEGLSSGRGQTSVLTRFRISAQKYAISETCGFAVEVLVSKSRAGTAAWGLGDAVCSTTSISSKEERDWELGSGTS